MEPSRQTETFDELVLACANGDLVSLAKAAKVSLASLRKLRSGVGLAQKSTMARLADALAVPIERVQAALRASREGRAR